MWAVFKLCCQFSVITLVSTMWSEREQVHKLIFPYYCQSRPWVSLLSIKYFLCRVWTFTLLLPIHSCGTMQDLTEALMCGMGLDVGFTFFWAKPFDSGQWACRRHSKTATLSKANSLRVSLMLLHAWYSRHPGQICWKLLLCRWQLTQSESSVSPVVLQVQLYSSFLLPFLVIFYCTMLLYWHV